MLKPQLVLTVNRRARGAALALLMLLGGETALARSEYLGFWRDTYPNSTSFNNPGQGCQLCHSRETGGNGWNFYGWSIRQELNGSQSVSRNSLNQALFFIELNSALDPGCGSSEVTTGRSFLDNIRANAQPGWMSGPVNNTRVRNGNCTAGVSPPDLSGSGTSTDFPGSDTAVTNPFPDAIERRGRTITLAEISSDFISPVNIVRAPGIDGSLFVIEQRGRIWRVDLATGNKTLFHDVGADLVDARPDFDERGLLGLAFHPDFDSNGLFYTYQSEPARSEQDALVDFSTLPAGAEPNHRSFVVEYQASEPSCNSPITRQRNLLIVDQPMFNHNAGDLAFDSSGSLFIAFGDGGGANDEGFGHVGNGNGSDPSNPLGSLLRILPDQRSSSNGQYGIPTDNPFVGSNDGLDEIYAYGLRNPYRFSFDSANGDLYVGDVGQNQIEEINRVVLGGNYGWNAQEGTFFFYSTEADGTFISREAPAGLPDDLLPPFIQYDHDEGLSVTGGYVYRGSAITSLIGDYVFADFSRGFSSSDGGRLFFRNNVGGTGNPPQREFNMVSGTPNVRYTGFGEDANNELYVVATETNTFDPTTVAGSLYRIALPGEPLEFPDSNGESAICEEPVDEQLCLPIRASNGAIAVVCL